MPSVNDAFPSEWLKPADLQGRAHTVTIKAYEQGEYMGKPQHILHFYETKKKLGLNKGTATAIAELLGESEMTKWADKKITIFHNREKLQGEWKDVIRVQMTSPINEQLHAPQGSSFGAPASPPVSNNPDDVPF